MVFDVIEDKAIWWVRLGKGVLVGPFAEHADAVTWARGFLGDDQDIAAMHQAQILLSDAARTS